MNPSTPEPDPELLEQLDLLLNWDALNEESEWETVQELDEVEDEST